MAATNRIFEAGKIGKMEVKNRLVMAAMGNTSATEDGYITERLIDYYVERAKGGVGVIVTQAFNVSRESHIPYRGSLFNDQFIAKLQALPDSIHKQGTKISIQLIRRSGATLLKYGKVSDHPIFVPSNLPSFGNTKEIKESSIEDIARLVEDFSEAARRAKEAGFDGVEFHGCHGTVCVLSLFLSPFTNRRNDRYGGTIENRARLACEVIARSREKVGPDFPLIFRMNGSDGL